MKHWRQRQPQPEEVPVRTQRNITIIEKLALSEFDIQSSELDPFTATRLIMLMHFRDFRCAVPGCRIHSRDVFTFFALDPQLIVGECIIPLCREHAIQVVTEDKSLTYGVLGYTLALVHQRFSGRTAPIIPVPDDPFHGLGKPKSVVETVSFADTLSPEVRAKLSALFPKADDP
jgi:hypothetical protein